MIKWLSLLVFLGSIALADTPPPGTVKLKGGTDGTTIGNVGDTLKVNATVSIPNPLGVTQSTTPWVTSGNLGRTWNLGFTTDSSTSYEGGIWTVAVNNFPSTYAVIQSTNPWIVNGSAFTQPISASSLPLPTGAATESTLSALNGKFTTTSNGVKVDGSAVTQPISGSVSVSNFPGTQPVSGTVTANQGTGGASAWKVDGSAVTQPVSGTVTANAGSGNFTVIQPTGTNLHTVIDSGTVTANQGTSPWVTSVSNFPATQAVTQSGSWTVIANAGTNLNTSALALDTTVSGLQISQGSTTSGQKGGLTLGAVTTAAPSYTTAQSSPFSLTTAGALRVDGSATTQPVSGTFFQATQPVSGTITANAGTNLNTSLLALESGGNLASTKTNTDNLNLAQASTTSGQKGNLILGATTTAAPSYTTAQSNPLSLTTAGALRTDSSGTTQPVSGTVTANAGTGNFTVVQGTGSNLHAQLDSGSTTAVTQGTAANLNATVVQSSGSNLHVNVDSAPTTTVTGTVTANAGTGTFSTNPTGKTSVFHVRNDYSSTNVTTGAYVQLVASTTSAITQLYIFDSSGQTLVLATGGAGSEVDQIYIVPGGNDIVNLTIASGTRVSIKAVSATASVGEIDINAFN